MTKLEIVSLLRRFRFNVPASELEAATAPSEERVALEAAANFLAGYLLAISRHTTIVWRNEVFIIEEIERGIVARLAELSARFHEETRRERGAY